MPTTFATRMLNVVPMNCTSSADAKRDAIGTTGFRPNARCSEPTRRHRVRTRASNQCRQLHDGDVRNVTSLSQKTWKDGAFAVPVAAQRRWWR